MSDTIKKQTHLKHMFAKDKEISFLKKMLDEQERKNKEVSKLIYNIREIEYQSNEFNHKFGNNIHLFYTELNSFRTFVLEVYKFMEDINKRIEKIEAKWIV